jgi:hypothetical protein
VGALVASERGKKKAEAAHTMINIMSNAGCSTLPSGSFFCSFYSPLVGGNENTCGRCS